MASLNLTAAYKSAHTENGELVTDTHNIKHTIPEPESETVQAKTQYLIALREAVSKTQDEINKELTARMEEDKARDAGTKPKVANGIDEDKEEENYGEEAQEEED